MLADAYAEPPFRVGRSFPEGDGLHMIMASSSPGIFGGDCLEQTIVVESGARVRLTSQSALQVHPSADGAAATLRGRYVVEEGASLSCFWDPLIPFGGSRLDQRFDLDIARDSRLSWSDAFMAGREARGERWRFALLAHELRLTRGGTLAYLERFRIEPRGDELSNRWIASGACYFGTTLAVCDGIDASVGEGLHRQLEAQLDVSCAYDLLESGLSLVRLMSSEGPAFHRARALAVSTLGSTP